MKKNISKGESIRTVLGILILFICLVCKGQPSHVAVMVNGQFEGAGSGNGTIAGVEVQDVTRKARTVVVLNGRVTWDKKSYLDRYGTALRLQAQARYFLPLGADKVFVAGGGKFGHVHYPDSATAKDGYTKYAFQPIVGGGVQVGDESRCSCILGYNYQFKTGLKAFGSSAVRILDGWTQGHEIKAETVWPVRQSKWLVLFNLAWSRTTYQRNPDIYGAVLGAVKHPYNATEVSIGFGRGY